MNNRDHQFFGRRIEKGGTLTDVDLTAQPCNISCSRHIFCVRWISLENGMRSKLRCMCTVILGLCVFSCPVFAAVIEAEELQKNFATEDFLLKVVTDVRSPKGMEFDLTGESLFVANMWGDTPKEAHVSVIDTATFQLDKKIMLPNGYYSKSREHANGMVEVTISSDNRFALISRLQGCGRGGCGKKNTGTAETNGQGLISVVDISTKSPVMYIPSGGSGSKVIGIKPDSQKGYITNWFSNDVGVFDFSEAYQIDSTSKEPIYDPEALKKMISFPRGSAPRGIAFGPSGKYMYVIGFTSKVLYVVDTETDRIIATTSRIRRFNFRHMVTNNDRSIGYISHMQGSGVSKVDLVKLEAYISKQKHSRNNKFGSKFWKEVFIPWKTAEDTTTNVMVLKTYPKDHPDRPNKRYGLAGPNTIALDRSNNCYLYVSFRSGNINGTSALSKGKVDVLDVCNDRRVISLIAGKGTTALAATEKGDVLAASGFFDSTIWFYDLTKIKAEYEKIYGVPEAKTAEEEVVPE